jgi:glycine reductase
MTAMTSMAQNAGANRILTSGRIPHPTGDPTRSPDEEFAWRKDQLRTALDALSTPLEEGQIFS